jgi:hypothetical protein
MRQGNIRPIKRFEPPNLIIQDELHLIEGPLGTLVGLYETAIDILCSNVNAEKVIKPKYIASSATIRNAKSQVSAVFGRKISIFPPPGLSISDNFFTHSEEPHPLNSIPPGRLYMGICVPGRGPPTATYRIWAALLKQAYELKLIRGGTDAEVDQFWTIIGYFNAIRTLASAVSLYKADIIERLGQLGGNIRNLEPHLELSSRMESSEIPGALEQLAKFPDNTVDGVFVTSMFGTGVDVDRLGLMIVHGQPKTTANYIQATGRIGRIMGGLVVTYLKSTRPRELDHYEFFIGYHRNLSRYVEPITVHPFSPRARERAIGPISVALLRNAEKINSIPVNDEWVPENLFAGRGRTISGSRRIVNNRNSPEITAIINAIENRSQIQPDKVRPTKDTCSNETASEFDRWHAVASTLSDLIYYESTMIRVPQNPVVLGDPQHEAANPPLTVVFRNSPQSLRDVESSATFEG